ncbi:uncharacterized protein K489DRAFT_384596 [Dissoconium aciculare CBS 342.82]|uniref:Uncharacterized protein n=1 Tax=Dissoconium aciculare CBS 342.82 TaxID=1314786 RepID=A0A6J3LTT5_9PEZI|nr:uncharacterized protein K489DRAFT_384596 [Dissoconium aciculare CBS 342.82]KAF1818689.1 hypothetical protein K489DRAFT_384596 [Dissoconium aciculare CBS 342.82]
MGLGTSMLYLSESSATRKLIDRTSICTSSLFQPSRNVTGGASLQGHDDCEDHGGNRRDAGQMINRRSDMFVLTMHRSNSSLLDMDPDKH